MNEIRRYKINENIETQTGLIAMTVINSMTL